MHILISVLNDIRYFLFKCVNYTYKNLTKSCFEYDIFMNNSGYMRLERIKLIL